MSLWQHELAVARAAAADAGRVASQLQHGVDRRSKSDGSPVTAGDLAADAEVKRHIHAAFPSDHIFSEEVADDQARLARSRVWIIDPIDGTRAYVEGREEWCVQVALAVDGVAVVGVLDLPARGIQVWATAAGAGILQDGRERPLTPVAGVDHVMAASSSDRNRPHLERVRAALPDFAWLPANSVGFKAAQVLLGEADLFVHPRHIAEWDACAPGAVIAGAGACATDLAGRPLRYNTGSGKVPGLVFSRRPDHQQVVARLAQAGIVLP